MEGGSGGRANGRTGGTRGRRGVDGGQSGRSMSIWSYGAGRLVSSSGLGIIIGRHGVLGCGRGGAWGFGMVGGVGGCGDR